MKITRNPIVYTSLIAFFSFMMTLLLFFAKSKSPTLLSTFLIITIVSVMGTVALYRSMCPVCKKPFARTFLNVKIDRIVEVPTEIYTKYVRNKDGTEQPVINSRRVIRRKKQIDNVYYYCKKCQHGKNETWVKKKSYFIDSLPVPEIITSK